MAGFLDFMGPITEAVRLVLNRVLPPEKMSEAERQNLTYQVQAAIMAQGMETLKVELADVADARKLAAAEVTPTDPYVVRLARGLMRPFIGFAVASVYVFNLLLPLVSQLVALPPVHPIALNAYDYALIGGIFTFLFGLRSAEKFAGKDEK